MENLAGNERCDQYITKELTRSRIPIVQVEKQDSEVPWSVFGNLNGFIFKRAWYYYMVSGFLPLEIAKELYADPVGKTDIRVRGDCGCPEPKGYQIEWFDKETNKPILSMREKEECEKYIKSESKSLKSIAEKTIEKSLFSDTPELTGSGFISSYHIDSEIGLRLFADTIEKYNLENNTNLKKDY
jgi:hypothetical protein